MTGTTSLGTLVVYLTANASQYQRAMKSVTASNGVAMEQLISSTKYAGVAIIGTLTAIGAASVREFGKFDEAMTKSMAIMGDVSRATRDELEKVARDIGRTTTTSATEAAKAYRYLASAGLDAATSMKALPAVQQFAASGAFDLEASTTMLTDSVSALGLASKDSAQYLVNLTRVSDVLTQAANDSNAEADQFATALRTKVASAARLLGKDVEEVVAVLEAYANQGIKAENAGDQLAQVMRDLQLASMKQPEIWREFGVNVYDAAGKMLPLVDIITQFEDVLKPMNDEQKKATLSLLGFQDRSVSAMQALLGTSGAIRDFEAKLRSVGGVTKEVADKQMTSFNTQWVILINNIKDAMITIGQQLAPVLTALNSYFKDADGSTKAFADQVKFLADIIKTALMTAVMVVMDVIAGWKLVIKGGEVAFTMFFSSILNQVADVGKGLNAFIKMWVDGINKAIDAINFLRQAASGRELVFVDPDTGEKGIYWIKKTAAEVEKLNHIEFKGFDFVADIENMAASSRVAVADVAEEFMKLTDAGRPSVEFQKRLDAIQATLEGTGDTAVEEAERINKALTSFFGPLDAITAQFNKVDAGLKDFFGDMDKGIKRITPEFIEFKQMTQDPLAGAYESVLKFDKVLQQGQITLEQYKLAVRDIVAPQNPFIAPVEGMHLPTGVEGVDQIGGMQNEITLLEDSYNRKLKATEDGYAKLRAANELGAEGLLSIERRRLEETREMEETYDAIRRQFVTKRNEVLLTSMSDSLGMMADVMGKSFGEQTAMYKVMFAASKAFAIADASVKIAQGIAAAAAQPWPLNMAAIASTIAATASMISNITSVMLSFDGGGFTPSGPRTGGVDGKGGFYAIMHPNEQVIDWTKEQSRKLAPRAMHETTNDTSNAYANTTNRLNRFYQGDNYRSDMRTRDTRLGDRYGDTVNRLGDHLTNTSNRFSDYFASRTNSVGNYFRAGDSARTNSFTNRFNNADTNSTVNQIQNDTRHSVANNISATNSAAVNNGGTRSIENVINRIRETTASAVTNQTNAPTSNTVNEIDSSTNAVVSNYNTVTTQQSVEHFINRVNNLVREAGAPMIEAQAKFAYLENAPGISSNVEQITKTTSEDVIKTLPSFSGGGYTPSTSRTGGVDGEGGFMAVMHPQERVIDLTKDDDIKQSGPTNVIKINQTFTGGVTQADLLRQSEATKRETMAAVAEGVRRGGSFRRAVQN